MGIAAVGAVNALDASRSAAPASATRSFGEVLSAAAPPQARTPEAGVNLLRSMGDGQRRLDEIVARARSGQAFSPRQLLLLQAEVYRISEEVALVQRVVEEGLSGLKRLWTMQL